jgi:hypothetical protein
MILANLNKSWRMLTPLANLCFDEESHRYRYRGEWLPWSVSGIASPLTPAEREQIMAKRHEWEPRGNQVHDSMERFLRCDDPIETEFEEWCDAGRRHWLVADCELMAAEYRLCHPNIAGGVGGSFDALVRNDDGVYLVDFKTVGSKKSVATRKPATAQLGAYAQMLNMWHPLVTITKCCTLVIGPGETRAIFEDPDACVMAWMDKVEAFKMKQELLGF